jgi:hypothetical protein
LAGLGSYRFGHALVGLALAAAILEGCSGAAKREEPKVDSNIFPAHYKDQIAAFMRTYLSNPTKVKDAYVAEPVLRPVAGTTHYITCVRYNPRDGANQYLGNQTNLGIFLGGELTQFLPADPQMCAGLAYQRFPEIESMVP